MTQINYIANVGTLSRKGFWHYKNFISKLESSKLLQDRNVKQLTVWEKIKRFGKKDK
jgi:hypothetical protein